MTVALNLESSSIKSNARREEIDRNVLASLRVMKRQPFEFSKAEALQEPNAVQASLTPHFLRSSTKPVERSLQIADHVRSFLLCQPLQRVQLLHVLTLEGDASHGVRQQ